MAFILWLANSRWLPGPWTPSGIAGIGISFGQGYFVSVLGDSHGQVLLEYCYLSPFVQPSAPISHSVGRAQAPAQGCWCLLDTTASPPSLLTPNSGWSSCSTVPTGARGWRGWSPVGSLGGEAQTGWGTTNSSFYLTETPLCLHKFQSEVFSFPVYFKELSKLEKLLKQELPSAAVR